MINRLQNINPGEKICYWEGSAIAKADFSGIEARNTAHLLYIEDRVELVQKQTKVNLPRCLGEHATGEYQYFAIGKKYPPDPKKVAYRKRYLRVLAAKPDLKDDD